MYDKSIVDILPRSLEQPTLERPMKPNPGPVLAPEDIFGRDEFIAGLWRVLDGNSVRMEAERRIGKTNVLRKMTAEPLAGWEPVYLDVEKVHSADEFAE